MSMIHKTNIFFLSTLALVVGAATAAGALPGPREPLTAAHHGIYGGWNDYFLRPDNGYDFLVMQATVPHDPTAPDARVGSHYQAAATEWNAQLHQARQAGKRVFAVIFLGLKSKLPLETLKQQFDFFMDNIDEQELYGISLAEENIYWDGHHDHLIELYRYAKAKYDVPVYQWYTPRGGTPGFSWPDLPADGWVIDEYSHLNPSYERFVREYKIHRLPMLSIIWAAPSMTDFAWKGLSDIALDQQWDVHRKYGIPSSFFCWSGNANIWGWHDEAPEIDRQVYASIVQKIKQFKAQPIQVNPDDWDQPEPTAVAMSCQLEPSAIFAEDYDKSGGSLVSAAGLTGFRHLRYRGAGVEFAPDAIGEAHASITYKLRPPFAPKSFGVRARATPAKGTKSQLTLSASGDGKQWSAPAALNSQGVATVELTGRAAELSGENIWVRMDLSGSASDADQNLLTIHSLTARSTFVPKSPEPIKLQAEDDGKVSYESDFANLSWLHTAQINERDALVLGSGAFGVDGRPGQGETVSLVQAFVADQPVNLQSLAIRAKANQPAHAVVVRLGVSLDGKNPIAQTSTSGEFDGWLELDAKSLESISASGDSKQFFVHVDLINTSGTTTSPSWVEGLKLQAQIK